MDLQNRKMDFFSCVSTTYPLSSFIITLNSVYLPYIKRIYLIYTTILVIMNGWKACSLFGGNEIFQFGHIFGHFFVQFQQFTFKIVLFFVVFTL